MDSQEVREAAVVEDAAGDDHDPHYTSHASWVLKVAHSDHSGLGRMGCSSRQIQEQRSD
jgi:hypothetical protein